jgi:hypothetical protein
VTRLPATGTLSCRAFPNRVMAVAPDLIELRKPQVDFVQQRGGDGLDRAPQPAHSRYAEAADLSSPSGAP